MYKSILVPLDGSELSEFVLPYAEELNSRLGCKIIPLRVYPSAEASRASTHQAYVDRVAQVLKERLGGGADVEPVIVAGEPNREIVGYAKKEDVGLIAAVARGQSGVGLWPVGSTADKVIRETSKPVLLIRAAAPLATREQGILNRVLLPLDGSKLSEAILPYVEDLICGAAGTEKAEVTLFEVLEAARYSAAAETYRPPEIQQLESAAREYLEGLGGGLRDRGVAVKSEVSTGMRSVAEEIVQFAHTSNANLIAMSTHGRSGFSRVFVGSVADRVLRSGEVPLLLVKPAAA